MNQDDKLTDEELQIANSESQVSNENENEQKVNKNVHMTKEEEMPEPVKDQTSNEAAENEVSTHKEKNNEQYNNQVNKEASTEEEKLKVISPPSAVEKAMKRNLMDTPMTPGDYMKVTETIDGNAYGEFEMEEEEQTNEEETEQSLELIPIKAATVDDLKNQLLSKKNEADKELASQREELNHLMEENKKYDEELNEMNESSNRMEKEMESIRQALDELRGEEEGKLKIARELQEKLNMAKEANLVEEDKLKVFRKTKGSIELVLKTLEAETEKAIRLKQEFIEKKNAKEMEYEQEEQRYQDVLQQFEDEKDPIHMSNLEEKLTQIEEKQGKELEVYDENIKTLRIEYDKLKNESEVIRTRLISLIDANHNKLKPVSRDIIAETFRLRVAIQFKQYIELVLLQQLEKILQDDTLKEKASRANHITPEYFMLKKTKAETDVIKNLQEMSNLFSFVEEDNNIDAQLMLHDANVKFSQEDAEAYETQLNRLEAMMPYNKLNPDLMTEYIHLSKLLQIQENISKSLEGHLTKVAQTNGEDPTAILEAIDSDVFNDDEEIWTAHQQAEEAKTSRSFLSRLKSSNSNDKHATEDKKKATEYFKLTDFLDAVPNKSTTEMEEERINVKHNILAAWRKKIHTPEDLLVQSKLTDL